MEKKSFGFIDNFTLKMIAIICMLIDHMGFVLFDNAYWMRAIGRIAFPIFCFLIVEGFHHTKSPMHYLLRLCIFALISEVPFDLAFWHAPFVWTHQNVFFTLALGLASLFCLEEMNTKRIYVIPLVAIWAAAYFIHCDYGLGGVLLIGMFYLTEEMPWFRALLAALILYLFYNVVELYGLIALIPITFYNGKRGPKTKMFFYWFYPVHLLILFLIIK